MGGAVFSASLFFCGGVFSGGFFRAGVRVCVRAGVRGCACVCTRGCTRVYARVGVHLVDRHLMPTFRPFTSNNRRYSVQQAMKTTEYFDSMPFESSRYALTEFGSVWHRGKDQPIDAGETAVWTLPGLSFGDYGGGGSAARANIDYVLKHYSKLFSEGILVQRFESHGGELIMLAETEVSDELADAFQDFVDTVNGLEDYPVIDEGRMSEVELQWEIEAWNGWAESDFIRAILKRMNTDGWNVSEMLDGFKYGEQFILELFETARERANVYWETEYSSSWIDVEAVAAKVTASDLLKLRNA
jgi:hypothetical protein